MSPINNSKLHQSEGNKLPQIQRSGQCLSLPQEYRDLLDDGFYVLLNRPVHDDAHGCNATLQADPLFPPWCFANYGLTRVLQHVVTVEKQRLFVWSHKRLQCNDARRTIEIEYPEAIRFISYYEHGIIRVSHVNDIADVIVDVIRSYSSDGSRIVIIGQGRLLLAVHKKVQKHFTKSLADQQSIPCYTDRNPYFGEDEKKDPRVAFSTPGQTRYLGTGHCKIAILLDAFECLYQTIEDVLCEVDMDSRVYGFQQVSRQPTPYEQIHLNRVFGFEQIEFGSHGRVRRLVSYKFKKLGGSCPQDAVFSQTGRTGGRLVNSKRAYVFHQRRNQKIRALAERLVPEYGNTLIILVENLDHAIQLGSKLPGWPIYARPKSNFSGISGEMRKRVNPRYEWGFIEVGVIIVADAYEQYRGETARVIIWAGGGNAVPIPRAWLFEKGLQDRPLTIYDFQDNFSRETRLASNRRREWLHELEIYESGKEPWVKRVQRFLSNIIRNPAGYEVFNRLKIYGSRNEPWVEKFNSFIDILTHNRSDNEVSE